jgi:tripartite-type tricarboxylate transporter receptor subunit TctC
MRWRVWLLLLLAGFGLGQVSSAAAETVAEFYKGKVIKVIIGYAPGGGFDAYARLLAENLPKYLPGNPTAVVQSMPGAASVKAANYIYSIGPQDGTLIGIPNHAVPMNAFVWREVGDGLDVTRLNWIGRLDAIDVVNVAWHSAGVKTIEDVKNRPLAIAATSPTGTSVMMPTAMNKLVGTQFKVVQGYKGTAEQYLAMEKGETEGMGNAIWSQLKRSHPHWIAEKKLVPLYQDGYKRAAGLEDVPTAMELAKNEEDRKVFRLLGSTAEVGRSFYVGPQVPAERVAALRQAFIAMTKDRAFIEEAESLNIVLNPMPGEDLQRMIGELGLYPPELLERTRQLVAP